MKECVGIWELVVDPKRKDVACPQAATRLPQTYVAALTSSISEAYPGLPSTETTSATSEPLPYYRHHAEALTQEGWLRIHPPGDAWSSRGLARCSSPAENTSLLALLLVYNSPLFLLADHNAPRHPPRYPRRPPGPPLLDQGRADPRQRVHLGARCYCRPRQACVSRTDSPPTSHETGISRFRSLRQL